jgi:hypothetical protein
MSNVVQFPETIRISDFMAEAALKQQIRQCLGCVVGLFHGQPSADEMLMALTKLDEAMTLMQSYRTMQIT